MGLLVADAGALCAALEFSGTVTRSVDLAGTAGHGAGPGVLDGRTVSGTVAVDAARAPVDSEASPELGIYASRNAATSWVAPARISIDGVPLRLPRFQGTVTARDADQHVRVFRTGELAVLRDLDQHDATTGEYLDYALALHLRGARQAGDALPASLAQAGYTSGWGSVTLMYQAPGRAIEIHVGIDFSVASLGPAKGVTHEACGGG